MQLSKYDICLLNTENATHLVDPYSKAELRTLLILPLCVQLSRCRNGNDDDGSNDDGSSDDGSGSDDGGGSGILRWEVLGGWVSGGMGVCWGGGMGHLVGVGSQWE